MVQSQHVNLLYIRTNVMQLGSMFISNCINTNKHTAKLHHVDSLYILTYDARKIKHKM
jgi:hypothetical protein